MSRHIPSWPQKAVVPPGHSVLSIIDRTKKIQIALLRVIPLTFYMASFRHSVQVRWAQSSRWRGKALTWQGKNGPTSGSSYRNTPHIKSFVGFHTISNPPQEPHMTCPGTPSGHALGPTTSLPLSPLSATFPGFLGPLSSNGNYSNGNHFRRCCMSEQGVKSKSTNWTWNTSVIAFKIGNFLQHICFWGSVFALGRTTMLSNSNPSKW